MPDRQQNHVSINHGSQVENPIDGLSHITQFAMRRVRIEVPSRIALLLMETR